MQTGKALVACAGVTLGTVATAIGVKQIATLMKLGERCYVVAQSLRQPPEFSVSR